MNMHKVALLCFGLLIGTETNQAAKQHPDSVGLRCEFNGEIDFFIRPNNIETDQAMGCIYETIKKTNPSQLCDTDDPRNRLIIENGIFAYRLTSNQWIWLMRNASIQLTLKPNPNVHIFPQEHVYFFNVFNKTLFIKISSEDYLKLRDTLFVRNPQISDHLRKPTWQCDCEGRVYSTRLPPGESIIYPANSGISITLES